MDILKASPASFVEVFYLLRVRTQEMDAKGWLHLDWQNDLITCDVEKGETFLFREHGISLGFILFSNDLLAESEMAQWDLASQRPLLVKYLIVHPFWHDKGIEAKLLTFAEQYAKDNHYTSLRLSAFAGDEKMNALFGQLSYKQTGEAFYRFRKTLFYGYEKALN